MQNDNEKLKIVWIKIKQNEKIISCCATIAMVIVTGIMAYFTYNLAKETKNLAELDLKPYITPKDVSLEFVDKGGTVIKRQTQLGFEDSYLGSVPQDNIDHISLAVKFNNLGKLEGIIKADNIKAYSTNSKIIGEFKPIDNEHIIAGSSESGWSFGITIDPLADVERNVFFDYSLTNFSNDLKFSRLLKFTVFCDFSIVEYEKSGLSRRTNCLIVPFGFRNKQQ